MDVDAENQTPTQSCAIGSRYQEVSTGCGCPICDRDVFLILVYGILTPSILVYH